MNKQVLPVTHTPMSAADMRAELDGIALAWWPELLLTMHTARSQEDVFTATLARLGECVREELALA